jgi:transmembrane sensor
LAEVIAQFNRRNQVQLELGDPALAGLPVDGSFRADNVEAFVRLLESSGAVRADRVSAERIVLRHE